MPRAFGGQFSPDGKRIVYEEIPTAFVPDWYETSTWRHYRGGRTQPCANHGCREPLRREAAVEG
jgi:hypothetical protein